MSVLRLGAAARLGAVPRFAFPGISIAEPEDRRRRLFATGLAAAAHATVFAALFAVAMLSPEPDKEQPLPVQLLKETPPPPPPKVEARAEPVPAPAPVPKPVVQQAPAPKALAERRSVNFQPSAQAVAPQVVNPSVIAQAAPVVAAPTLKLDAGSVTAPREIKSAAAPIDAVAAVSSVAAPRPTQFDVSSSAAPALRGPRDADAPAGPSVGPKAITTGGDSVGTGPVKVGNGSSVGQGRISTRDVDGSPDGSPLADVNTRVGQGYMRGPGGTGTEIGGGSADCRDRPEVKAYLAQLKDRTLARWTSPLDVPDGELTATLRWKLDVGGSVSQASLLNAADPRLGSSVVDALRSASPFAPMSERVRCLAGEPIVGTFILDRSKVKASIAN
jgi:outer membrane biosynthesis protein TonB